MKLLQAECTPNHPPLGVSTIRQQQSGGNNKIIAVFLQLLTHLVFTVADNFAALPTLRTLYVFSSIWINPCSHSSPFPLKKLKATNTVNQVLNTHYSAALPGVVPLKMPELHFPETLNIHRVLMSPNN